MEAFRQVYVRSSRVDLLTSDDVGVLLDDLFRALIKVHAQEAFDPKGTTQKSKDGFDEVLDVVRALTSGAKAALQTKAQRRTANVGP